MPSAGSGDAVLLTGATGFLGGYLAAELLAQTPLTVYCLVRGRSPEGAARRLRTGLERRGAPASHRVVPVHGNLLTPMLGLCDKEYHALADSVSAVYHCAASVNLAAELRQLAPINVAGTEAVLRFAADAGAAPVHLVSTLGVFLAARAMGVTTVDERTEPLAGHSGAVGYAHSKYLAEMTARDADLPVTIYRPGLILGHRGNGRCPDGDFMARLLRAALLLRAAPECVGDAPVAPVDEVARALVALSRQPAVAGRAFHLVAPEQLPFRAVFEQARAAGYPLAVLGLREWRRLLADRMGQLDAFVMLAMWKVAAHLLAETPDRRVPRVGTALTTGRLGAVLAPADAGLLGRMLRFLANRGTLPAPLHHNPANRPPLAG